MQLMYCLLLVQRISLSDAVCEDEIYFFKKQIVPHKVRISYENLCFVVYYCAYFEISLIIREDS